eukprot:3338192-Prymnesium_polylepis.1
MAKAHCLEEAERATQRQQLVHNEWHAVAVWPQVDEPHAERFRCPRLVPLLWRGDAGSCQCILELLTRNDACKRLPWTFTVTLPLGRPASL